MKTHEFQHFYFHSEINILLNDSYKKVDLFKLNYT